MRLHLRQIGCGGRVQSLTTLRRLFSLVIMTLGFLACASHAYLNRRDDPRPALNSHLAKRQAVLECQSYEYFAGACPPLDRGRDASEEPIVAAPGCSSEP